MSKNVKNVTSKKNDKKRLINSGKTMGNRRSWKPGQVKNVINVMYKKRESSSSSFARSGVLNLINDSWLNDAMPPAPYGETMTRDFI